jgi:hypothetical protein
VVSSQTGFVLACVLRLTSSGCLRALSRKWHSLVGWTEARYFLMAVKLSDAGGLSHERCIALAVPLSDKYASSCQGNQIY